MVGYPRMLQEQLEAAIVSEDFESGADLSVDSLVDHFNTDETKARTVLESAFRKGLVEKVGGGKYAVVGKQAPTITSVFQHADKSGLKPKSVVRSVEIIQADVEIAKKLKMVVGENVYRQTRTRLVNDQVVANQNNYIPVEVCPGLEEIDLSRTSFQVTLEGKYNSIVACIEEKFRFIEGNQEDLEILRIEVGTRVLVVERLSLSPSGLPLVWADIHVCTDHYHYVKALWPGAADLIAG